MSNPLILVTTFDGVMADGRRIAWQSFRPANTAPGSKPTLYSSTLGGDPDANGVTTYNLRTAGVQATVYSIEMTVMAGEAELTLPGQAPVKLKVGTAVTIPARGPTGEAAVISFAGDSCSLKVVPNWPTATTSPLAAKSLTTLSATAEDGGTAASGSNGGSPGSPPPPPLPGGEENP